MYVLYVFYTVQCVLCSVYCVVCIVYCVLYMSGECVTVSVTLLLSLHQAAVGIGVAGVGTGANNVRTVYCILLSVYFILCTVYCILYTIYYILYTIYYICMLYAGVWRECDSNSHSIAVPSSSGCGYRGGWGGKCTYFILCNAYFVV
jgi:hypothetical protein